MSSSNMMPSGIVVASSSSHHMTTHAEPANPADKGESGKNTESMVDSSLDEELAPFGKKELATEQGSSQQSHQDVLE
jgi:hypothetical protein